MKAKSSVVSCQLSVAAATNRCLRRTTDYGLRTGRRGLSLIELLVVIIILTTVVAAAIPILAPADNERNMREASRGLNTYITGAPAKAISLNRPVGVALKRLSQSTGKVEDNAVCLEVYYVEQQSPYAGFDANSRARVGLYTPSTRLAYSGATALVVIQFISRAGVGETDPSVDGLPVGWDADAFPGVANSSQTGGLIRPGDVIEINGSRYQLLADSRDTDVDARLDASNTFFREDTGSLGTGKPIQIVALALNDTGQMLNITHDEYGAEIANPTPRAHNRFFTSPAPYKILRQPMPSSDESYQLPEGTAIDLRASGVGSNDYFYYPNDNDDSHPVTDNLDPVIIMFTPEGRVSRVTYSQFPPPTTGNEELTFDRAVTDNVFLLIGLRGKIPAPAVSNDQSLAASGITAASTAELRNKLREPVNWLNGSTRWVVIGPQSGRVATIENALVDPNSVLFDTNPPIIATEGTELMRTRQILAAREFTRRMGQMGGR